MCADKNNLLGKLLIPVTVIDFVTKFTGFTGKNLGHIYAEFFLQYLVLFKKLHLFEITSTFLKRTSNET